MKQTDINSIDDVLSVLDEIILQSVTENNTLGYFAALYRQVTAEVKKGIETNYFDDGQRMEKLDVVFAKRYIDAYYAWNNNKPVKRSWKVAFEYSQKNEPIVLQHLLMGMNAHINLDLGIAAAEVSPGKKINGLRDDFFRINEILARLVNDVQNNLSTIWPPLKQILLRTGKLDNLVVDFSMELARDGAWKFAKHLSMHKTISLPTEIAKRDEKVAQKAKLITSPGFGIKLLLLIIRLGETGTVAKKIRLLKAKIP